MAAFIFMLYALGHLGLFCVATTLLVRRHTPGSVPLMLVTAGLVYDNAMLALGGGIGLGQQLEQLSIPRYFMHAMSTPLLILSALALVQRTGWRWSHATITKVLVAAVVVVLVATGFWADMLNLELEAQTEGGITSYGNANSIPIAPIVTILLLVGAALLVWRRGGGIWFLLGTFVQLATVFVGDAVVFAGNFGELALLAGMVWTDWRLGSAQFGKRA